MGQLTECSLIFHFTLLFLLLLQVLVRAPQDTHDTASPESYKPALVFAVGALFGLLGSSI